ncbi:MAG: PD-(D/E)XK nuclease family protein [Chloroflexi bacterium]|nr:PD-(D/E)XK nuclease family protein [Chloroflexota bacterium]
MPTHLYLALAAAGKTAYVLAHARAASRDLVAVPRVAVPTHLQARAARRRLAETGGAIGVRVLTFDRLYAEILNAAGEIYVELSEPVQYRLIRAVVDSLPLTHYAPLADRPGFIQVLQRLIGELKAARVHPDVFSQAVQTLGAEPRLAELAQIYAAYQARLQTQGWADRAGLGWLAVEALEQRAPEVGRDWPLLAVDGFDSFTPIQTALLQALAGRVGELVVTLTGEPVSGPAPLAHRRFVRTRATLETALGTHAEPLPVRLTPDSCPLTAVLAHLERGLFRSDSAPVDATGAVELIEAPERGGEARAALRWLKQRVVTDGCRPGEVALLARNVAPYRPFIQQTAAEFGLPIRLVDGLPLAENPAVAALLGLLQMALPNSNNELSLPRRAVVEAWRSPYFDWSALSEEGAAEPVGIGPGDADDLDAVARWGRVIGGEPQWAEAFDRLSELAGAPSDEEERGVPAGLPRGQAARALRAKFAHFVARVTPPDEARSYRAFVGWLETLIGADAPATPGRFPVAEDPSSLQVVAQARGGAAAVAERDIAALAGLKDVLRGLVWAEEALGAAPIDFTSFVTELTGALDAASYRLPVHADREEILVADVVQARGLPFQAVAVLGLAEGEFPATLSEDPFLRDADRRRLRVELGLPLELSTEGAEAEFFYEAVTRPRARLLLTRPRLADNGAPWQASPYWEAVRRLVRVAPERLSSESAPRPGAVASWPELLESLAVHDGYAAVRRWVGQAEPTRTGGVAAAAQVLQFRRPAAGGSPFDGDLSGLADACADRFAPERTWSASRLEAYRNCPFAFFVSHVLELEPRAEPVEGLDARQLGNIYHHIFEGLYGTATGTADLDALLAALPAAAGAVLDDAPRREGFRATAWWTQTRAEIAENVRRSVAALAALPGGFVPVAQEAAFLDSDSLTVTDGADAFRVHGYIDRVDRAPDGGLRIIDYKTGGPAAFTVKAVVEGKKLQLPLYALAAEQALGLGPVTEGFYWHVQHAEASKFSLAGFAGGPAAAIATALAHAWAAVRGARAGQFVPHVPDGGCPDYCPAVAFCWRYRARW